MERDQFFDPEVQGALLLAHAGGDEKGAGGGNQRLQARVRRG